MWAEGCHACRSKRRRLVRSRRALRPPAALPAAPACLGSPTGLDPPARPPSAAPFMKTVSQGAATSVFAATAREWLLPACAWPPAQLGGRGRRGPTHLATSFCTPCPAQTCYHPPAMPLAAPEPGPSAAPTAWRPGTLLLRSHCLPCSPPFAAEQCSASSAPAAAFPIFCPCDRLLAAELEGKGGAYLADCQVSAPCKAGQDAALAAAFWEKSEELLAAALATAGIAG